MGTGSPRDDWVDQHKDFVALQARDYRACLLAILDHVLARVAHAHPRHVGGEELAAAPQARPPAHVPDHARRVVVSVQPGSRRVPPSHGHSFRARHFFLHRRYRHPAGGLSSRFSAGAAMGRADAGAAQRQPSAGAMWRRMFSITCALYATPSWLGTVSSSVSASAMASSARSCSISRSGSSA